VKREHGFTGSYSAAVRMMRQLKTSLVQQGMSLELGS
jgi:hypothetical protein